MARTKKSTTESQLEQQLINAAVLANALAKHQGGQTSAQAMVGIRNISDLTIGIPAAFGQAEIHLHAAVKPNDPNTMTVIPYVWWRELRKGKLVQDGYLLRDDNIMGEGYLAAPADRPEDLAPGFAINAVLDPKEWIESRDETGIRTGIAEISSLNSLRRIRRAVDDKLREIVQSLPDNYRDNTPASNGYVPKGGWDNRHKLAVDQLPMIYRLVDDLTTKKIEGAD